MFSLPLLRILEARRGYKTTTHQRITISHLSYHVCYRRQVRDKKTLTMLYWNGSWEETLLVSDIMLIFRYFDISISDPDLSYHISRFHRFHRFHLTYQNIIKITARPIKPFNGGVILHFFFESLWRWSSLLIKEAFFQEFSRNLRVLYDPPMLIFPLVLDH